MLKKTGMVMGILLAAAGITTSAAACETVKIDKVLVLKSERKLYLMSGDRVVKRYPVSLGATPIGHKLQKGDKKTPEGSYILYRRNPESKYYKSIHISYPNEQDRQRAAKNGVHPGGDIAIHGLPTESKDEAWDYIERDWTDGCIAVTNEDMQEIWDLVENKTPIEIIP